MRMQGGAGIKGFGFSLSTGEPWAEREPTGDCDRLLQEAQGADSNMLLGLLGQQVTGLQSEARRLRHHRLRDVVCTMVVARDGLCYTVEMSPTGGLMPVVRKESRRTPRFWS